jgi:hypothetical protein
MIKLAERLKAIEQFVLGHKPPPDIRTHLHVLQEYLEMEDSLLDRIATNDTSHAKIVADMLSEKAAEKAAVDAEFKKLKAENARLVAENAQGPGGDIPGGFGF